MEVGTNKWGNLIPGKEGGALVGDIKRKMSDGRWRRKVLVFR